MAVERLGPWSGTYRPDYSITIYQGGDPSKPLTGLNLRSVTRIATSKSLDNIAGTFDITFKDRRAQQLVKPMDVVKIRLKGHNQGWGTVLVGVVDEPSPGGSAATSSAQADVTISGRCTAKYLQINSLFLPAWDPLANLPTALIFGKGDATNKLGTTVNAYTPRAIFGYIFDHFVVGLRNRVGLSGTPNARFWLSRSNRFEFVKDASGKVFQVPFIQFDEDSCDTALTRLQIQGFTEAWVDEVGNIVYRRPAWDAPVSWSLHTDGLKDWSLPSSDVGMATYVEVFPGALPALPSGVAQAMMAGRAPIPSDYVTGLRNSGFKSIATPEFIIDTDSSGKVTSKGARNWYYQKQKQYGLRPYQITSPLLASREQAQAQAEGLLRFMLRWDKSGSFSIPGEPNVRLGQTIYLHGPLKDQNLARTYYVQGIQHEYVEGDHYTTTLTLTHGRDPGDPSWQQMALPNFDPSQLANLPGLLNPTGKPGTGGGPSGGLTDPAPGATWGRLDMGYDGNYDMTQGAVAPYDGTIQGIGIPGWPGDGQYFVVVNDNQSGPDYTRAMYFAEGATPIYSNGTHVHAGQKIGNPVARGGDGSPGNFEIGPANTSGYDTLAKSYGLNSPGARKMVLAFASWLNSAGAGPSTNQSSAGGP